MLNRHRSMSRFIESPTARNRRCPSCRHGMAMVQADDGPFCQYCGWSLSEPTDTDDYADRNPDLLGPK